MTTPQNNYPELAKSIGVSSIFLKREDLHPYGSHKGRSIPIMIDSYIGQGFGNFAISSSGNSALAAGLHIQNINGSRPESEKINLDIIVGKNIKPHKLAKINNLKDENIRISMDDRPVQVMFQKTKDESIKGLRQSTDDLALTGYNSLAEELSLIKDLRAVFVATSSGTTAQALSSYFLTHKMNIEVHIVQTSSCHPIALEFVDDGEEEKSLADAIVDHVALRKNTLVPLLRKTGGSGWIAKNEEILTAQDLAKKHAVPISANGALSLVGAMQASYTGKTWDGPVACIIGGE